MVVQSHSDRSHSLQVHLVMAMGKKDCNLECKGIHGKEHELMIKKEGTVYGIYL